MLSDTGGMLGLHLPPHVPFSSMSLMKLTCRVLSILFLLAGIVTTGLLLASSITSASAMNAQPGASQSLGAGFALLVSFGSAIASGVTGLLSSVLLWWMGNVHDYLRNLVR